ncbi:hypothetical protein [uncultured Clostridium sp.]|jgi:hypothetical protein|uniref:hypothetical protein n=1 Tax=uncultured Clostridium sp. TaxID=59620 RepID=UPI00260934A1|nr:hypothetical protein [uncultured Clostridium sp.]
MKKVIGSFFVGLIILIIGICIYNLVNQKHNSSIIFSDGNQPTTNVANKKIIDLTNNVALTKDGVKVYLGVPKGYVSDKIKACRVETVGKLRNYILSWYNDGNQIDSYKESVNYSIPSKEYQSQLYLFSMDNQDKKDFLKKYGAENIMITIGTANSSSLDSENVCSAIMINGIPAFGFTVFNNKMMVEGNKLFYYGFITGDGVVIPAHQLKEYGREGKVQVIETGQAIDFNGANNGQAAWLV